jgi:5-(aminomethyl)-3-furanmethanol phosphate kinase
MPSLRPLTVVKLGGSYAFSPALGDWLEIIAGNAGHVVLVPGGGPFADTVREAQPKMGFDDAAAHHMALLAMEQYGRALVSLNETLALASSLVAIRRLLSARKVPVWAPARMVLGQADIPSSWDVTSDSLAAWLARRLRAPRLLLIKHLDPPKDPVRADDLVRHGIIDRAFVPALGSSGIAASIIGPAQHAEAARALARGEVIGSRIGLR